MSNVTSDDIIGIDETEDTENFILLRPVQEKNHGIREISTSRDRPTGRKGNPLPFPRGSLREKGRDFQMNNIVEMMNQSTARMRKILEGNYNEIRMKNARREFTMQIELLSTAIRAYRTAAKNKKMADALQTLNIIGGVTLIELGLDDSEIQKVIEQTIEMINQCGEMMKKIKENRSTVELDAALREYKLQTKLFSVVIRAKGALKKKAG